MHEVLACTQDDAMSTTTTHSPLADPTHVGARLRGPVTLLVALMSVLALAAAGCASGAPLSGPGIGGIPGAQMRNVSSNAKVALPAPGSTINAGLSEWKIAVPTTLAAGKYTFHITNTGMMEHEMLVMKTDLAPAQLPMKDGELNEDALPPMSDGPNIAPGKTQDRTIDLTKPGKYLFVCNLPGHFAKHMYTYVTVVPDANANIALPAPGSTINAGLSEWKIAVPTTLAAGKYTFHITNTGMMEHEMLVMKTDLAPAQLPMKDGELNEDALPPMSDGPNIAPGKTQDRTIDLTKPGKYLFVCNLPGHFAKHMYTYVTVVPDANANIALPTPGSTINAGLSEWKIAVPTTLAAGKYTFHITNTGMMEHEMLVMKTDLAPAQLPMKDGELNEDALPPMSDGPNIAPGKTQDRTIDLTKPGKYLFVCNLPGHFAKHMYTYVTVQ